MTKISPKLREQTLKYWFDGGFKRCVVCNSNSRVQLHHIYLDGDPYQDTKPQDLIPLCSSCHHKVEYFPDSRLSNLARKIARERRDGDE